MNVKILKTVLSTFIFIILTITLLPIRGDESIPSFLSNFEKNHKYKALEKIGYLEHLIVGCWNDGDSHYCFRNNGNVKIYYIKNFLPNDPDNTVNTVTGQWVLNGDKLTISVKTNNINQSSTITITHMRYSTMGHGKYITEMFTIFTDKPFPFTGIYDYKPGYRDRPWRYTNYFEPRHLPVQGNIIAE